MRKLFIGLFVIFAAVPFILSFIAKYYLQHQLVNNFAADVEIKALTFSHGWFSSDAELELAMNNQNILIRSNNDIHHGPVIWSTLFTDPFNSFSLYKIDTDFDLLNQRTGTFLSDQSGFATTRVSYTGSTQPSIQHPGFDLSVLDQRIFADLAQIDSQLKSNGTLLGSFKANQFEFGGENENIYLVQPALEIVIDPEQSFPRHFQLAAVNASSSFNRNQYDAGGLNITGELNQNDATYQLDLNLLAEQFNINRASASDMVTSISAINLDSALIEYVSVNFDSISQSIQNNQWLVVLKHFSQFLKLINTNQPELWLSLTALTKNQPIKFDFSGRLLANDETELNPFSLLDNLNLKLEAELPANYINELEQPAIQEFVQSMLEKSLLIEKHQSYYANLSFENTKLKVNH